MSSNMTSSSSSLHYEEWLLQHREIKKKKENDKNALLFSSRASCPLLQAAVVVLGPDQAAARALWRKTTYEMNREARVEISGKIFESIKLMPSPRMVETNSDEVDVDSFFEEYPDCERPKNELYVESDSESEEEEDDVVIVRNKPAPEVIAIYDDISPAHQQQRDTAAPMPRTTAPQQRPSPPNYPYSAHPPPAYPPSAAVHHPPAAATTWDAVRQAQNPFQTAREYAYNGPEEEDPRRPQPQQQQQPPQNPYAQNYAQPQAPQQPIRGPHIPESLKRKFQPPKRLSNEPVRNDSTGGSRKKGHILSNGGGTVARTSNDNKSDDDDLPEELRGLDKELVEKIQNEIMESGESVTFDDIAGLVDAKQTVQEVVCWPMKRPDLFTGLRRGPNGLLMFGPPGTGKTLIGKAIAHESGATFFSISSSSLTSKWIGEGEKLVRTLFAVAAYREPAVVFIDEIDSLLTQRKADENEASRRIKTEFLVQLDGTGTKGRVLVIGATNRPQELDDAARRRFVKRLYIPLPIREDRETLLRRLLSTNRHRLADKDLVKLSEETEGYSGADLKALAADAAMGPIRQLGPKALEVDPNDIPPISYKHFRQALRATTPSVAQADLDQYIEWDRLYGSKSGHAVQEDDDDDEDSDGAN